MYVKLFGRKGSVQNLCESGFLFQGVR